MRQAPTGASPGRGVSLGTKIGHIVAQTAAVFFTVLLCLFGFAIVLTIGIGLILAPVLSGIADLEGETLVVGDSGADAVFLSVPITGVILGDPVLDGGGSFGEITFGYDVKSRLVEAADDEEFDGVILEINSPGGTIYGSEAIADGVEYYKAMTGNPVIAFVSGAGASGAYLAATPTDEILVDAGSLVGSIGVIFGPFEFFDVVTELDGGILAGGVVTQNGIDRSFFTAGRSKDVGNPWRRLTQEEIDVLQTGVNDEYGRFVERVATGRELPPGDVREKIGALVYGNDQAIDLGLIDTTANLDEAYARLAELAGVSDYAVVQAPFAVSPFLPFLGALLDELPGNAVRAESGVSGDSDRSVVCRLSTVYLAYHGDPAALCT